LLQAASETRATPARAVAIRMRMELFPSQGLRPP
jgi:hypothetical protein